MNFAIFIMQVVCVLANVPGMLDGNQWSTGAFGFCLAILFATTYNSLNA